MPHTKATLTRNRERAWVEVDSAALLANLNTIRRVAGQRTKVIPMVKADAYGLGAERAIAAFRPAKPFGYGVATVDEGIHLRKLGVREPVLICAPILPADLSRAISGGLTPSISDLESLAALQELELASWPGPGPPSFQVEIDTGMGRAGFSSSRSKSPLSFPEKRNNNPSGPPQTADWWQVVQGAIRRGLHLFGVFTHLHSADEADLDPTRAQVARFGEFVRETEEIGPETLIHFANSAAALRMRYSLTNAVRPGIYLYGGHIRSPAPPPEPVVAVRARVVLVREVPAGTTVGYGATYRSPENEQLATVSIGYGDGVPRLLGNRGYAITNGERLPMVGRISMDTTVIKVGKRGGVSAGDCVTWIGRDGGAEITLDEVAKMAGTIGYEVLTGLSPRLPRLGLMVDF